MDQAAKTLRNNNCSVNVILRLQLRAQVCHGERKITCRSFRWVCTLWGQPKEKQQQESETVVQIFYWQQHGSVGSWQRTNKPHVCRFYLFIFWHCLFRTSSWTGSGPALEPLWWKNPHGFQFKWREDEKKFYGARENVSREQHSRVFLLKFILLFICK